MGGCGSGRWRSYTKRTTVEDSGRLYIKTYRETLRAIERGEKEQADFTLSWSLSGRRMGTVMLVLIGGASSIEAWLDQLETDQQPAPYQVGLESAPTSWGSRRYFWICPTCGQRCTALYIPPGYPLFACRKCHDLTYASCQTSHKYDRFISRLEAKTGLRMTQAEARALLTWQERGGEPSKELRGYWSRESMRLQQQIWEERAGLQQAAAIRMYERIEQEQAEKRTRYLSAGELSERAGLTRAELESLQAVRLIVPDLENLYRPKLAGWARKLATLLHAGWTPEEIKRWSTGRWSTSNPRAWPPERAAWQQTTA